ncbi:MAG TPA: chromosome partitioning protein [Frankiaceae bacterium]|nr:chromosome partitioning protein [Frankiaceae bacterium]
MKVPVLTAVADADREAEIVAAFEETGSPVQVVRRCVDLADLLATAAAGTVRAVVLDADLRRLDRDALSRLAVCGVAVVGLAGDDEAERRLRGLGVLHVAPANAPAGAIAGTVVDAVASVTLGVPLPPPETAPPPPAPDTAPGPVVAVWGPTGAPGRTTLAVNLAVELAGLGEPTVLVDADVYGGCVAQALGLLDEAPGLAAATRLANNGLLDATALAGVAIDLTGTLRVLTGISRAERWPELRPAAVENVLDRCRATAAFTVVDCAFCVEDDLDARRNAATLAILAAADTVLAVGSADPVSLQRLVRALGDLGRDATVVVNRLRPGVIPGDPKAEITEALRRYAGVTPSAFLPFDPAAADEALKRGQSLTEAAPGAPLRHAIRDLARTLAGQPAPPRRRRLLRR